MMGICTKTTPAVVSTGLCVIFYNPGVDIHFSIHVRFIIITTPHERTFAKKIRMCTKAVAVVCAGNVCVLGGLDTEETKPILIGESGMITFTGHFKYLGSNISYSLKDYYDIEHRIYQASAAMGALNNFWIDNTVNNLSKYLIFCAIPCNLLLWGCESWAIREATLKKL